MSLLSLTSNTWEWVRLVLSVVGFGGSGTLLLIGLLDVHYAVTRNLNGPRQLLAIARCWNEFTSGVAQAALGIVALVALFTAGSAPETATYVVQQVSLIMASVMLSAGSVGRYLLRTRIVAKL